MTLICRYLIVFCILGVLGFSACKREKPILKACDPATAVQLSKVEEQNGQIHLEWTNCYDENGPTF